ncbi:MAG TPA: hypothetical protein VHH13_11380, partial [Arthrobacter sp.]|nr:hypothetical protein [Arthrobacter sp.]
MHRPGDRIVPGDLMARGLAAPMVPRQVLPVLVQGPLAGLGQGRRVGRGHAIVPAPAPALAGLVLPVPQDFRAQVPRALPVRAREPH